MNSENGQGVAGSSSSSCASASAAGVGPRPSASSIQKRPVRCWPASLACSNARLLARAESAHCWRALLTETAKTSHTYTSAAWSAFRSSSGNALSSKVSSSSAVHSLRLNRW